jgi:hypothetical protein
VRAEQDHPALAAPAGDDVGDARTRGPRDDRVLGGRAEELLRRGELIRRPGDRGQRLAAGEERPVVVGDRERCGHPGHHRVPGEALAARSVPIPGDCSPVASGESQPFQIRQSSSRSSACIGHAARKLAGTSAGE